MAKNTLLADLLEAERLRTRTLAGLKEVARQHQYGDKRLTPTNLLVFLVASQNPTWTHTDYKREQSVMADPWHHLSVLVKRGYLTLRPKNNKNNRGAMYNTTQVGKDLLKEVRRHLSKQSR